MEIVISPSYGNNDLSDEIKKECGIGYLYSNANRSDKKLIEYIKKNGEYSSSYEGYILKLDHPFSTFLQIVEIPKGTRYRIIDEEGSEEIEYFEDLVWEVAD